MGSDFVLIREWDRYLAALGRADATRRNYRYAVFRFLGETCPESLSSVSESDVTGFLTGIGKRAAARRVYLQALRSLFGWAHKRKLIPENPTEFLTLSKPHRPPVVALEPEELTRVIYAAANRSPRRAWAIMLCFALGTRRSELAHITPGDIDPVSRTVLLRVTKGDRPRRMELGPLAEAALEGLRPWYNGTILGGVNAQAVTSWASEAAKACGLGEKVKHRPAHVLRASFVTYLLNAGIPVQVVSEMVGHAELATTTRYAATTGRQRRAAAGLL